MLLILGVACVQTAFRAFWYSRKMFGNFWLEVNGITNDSTEDEIQEISKNIGFFYVIQFILQLVTNFVLFVLIGAIKLGYAAYIVEPPSINVWLGFGFLVFAGLIVPVVIQNEIWIRSDNLQKIKKTIVVCGQLLVSTMIACLVFGLVGN